MEDLEDRRPTKRRFLFCFALAFVIVFLCFFIVFYFCRAGYRSLPEPLVPLFENLHLEHGLEPSSQAKECHVFQSRSIPLRSLPLRSLLPVIDEDRAFFSPKARFSLSARLVADRHDDYDIKTLAKRYQQEGLLPDFKFRQKPFLSLAVCDHRFDISNLSEALAKCRIIQASGINVNGVMWIPPHFMIAKCFVFNPPTHKIAQQFTSLNGTKRGKHCFIFEKPKAKEEKEEKKM